MRIAEVDAFLRTYTKPEKEALIKAARGFEPGSGEPGLMASEAFLKEYEEIGIYKHDRFMPVRDHFHNYIELTYVWSGTFVQVINGEKVICRTGDVCILNTQAMHSIEKAGEEDIIVNILLRKELFDHAFLGRLSRQGALAEFLIESVIERKSKSQYLLFQMKEAEGFRELIARIISEFYSERLGKGEVLKSCAMVMFTELLRTYGESARKKGKNEKNVHAIELLEYIEKNYQDCSLTQMARTFGFHPAYMTAMLKETTGRSFLEHVQEQKMSKPKNLLTGTDVPVAEIVSQCGYQNQSFFYKKFKESEGMTPAAYRGRFRI